MTTEIDTYCRLCAEPTPEIQMIKPDDDVYISSETASKMLWINIDVSSNNNLPKTICFSCFDLLEKTWHFLQDVRKAHDKLCLIFAKELGGISPPPEQQLSATGKPVNKTWQDFDKLKVKIEVQNMDEIVTVDPTTLLNNEVNLEIAPNIADYRFDDSDTIDSDDTLIKHSKQNKKKNKRKLRKKPKTTKRTRSDPNVLPLESNLTNMSWVDYKWCCGKCNFQYETLGHLRMHSLEIHSCCCVFKCYNCHKIFTSYKMFLIHVRKHYKQLKYWCEVCNKKFTMLSYLKQHKRVAHAIEYLLSCQACGTTFDNTEQLDNHTMMYGRKKEDLLVLNLKCEFCNKELKTKRTYDQHKLLHSERTRDYQCQMCEKTFFTKNTLQSHMAVHLDVKPFKCEYCEMDFKSKGNLLAHISLHSGTKPFICETCGKGFREKKRLRMHSIVHTDLMPYVCHYCNKQFRFKTRLDLHLRQHTGARPYTCEECQRNFTNGSNYKKHMRRRHNIEKPKKTYVIVDGLQDPMSLHSSLMYNQ